MAKTAMRAVTGAIQRSVIGFILSVALWRIR
jgi:hypothetical protein